MTFSQKQIFFVGPAWTPMSSEPSTWMASACRCKSFVLLQASAAATADTPTAVEGEEQQLQQTSSSNKEPTPCPAASTVGRNPLQDARTLPQQIPAGPRPRFQQEPEADPVLKRVGDHLLPSHQVGSPLKKLRHSL